MTKGVTHSDIKSRKTLDLRAGDTVRVEQKIEEKGKTRLQSFEGLVLAVKHGKTAGASFTVRKVASGVGVEKVFPLYSPSIDSINIVRRSKVRKSKLYYIREKVSREIKRQMRNIRSVKEVVEEAVEETPAAAEVEPATTA